MSANPRVLMPIACLLTLLTGCATVGTSVGRIVDPFNLVGLGAPPIRIGVTRLDLSPPPLLLPKAVLFEENLSFHLGSAVSIDLLTPRQIRVHLGSGRLKFAMLSTEDYCAAAPGACSEILAVPLNEHKQAYRKGLIVVAPKSPIRSLSDIRSQRFHFMPRGNLLNEAAVGALMDAGLSKADLDKGLLGLELDTYHISSLEVAKAVVLEGRAAGVIDEADYLAWRDTGGSLLLLSPSKDQVRVIGETVRIPEGPFVVSVNTDPALKAKVQDYLLQTLPKRKLVLAALGCTGFAPPIDPKEYEPYCRIHYRLHPETQPPEPQDSPETRPAESQPAP